MMVASSFAAITPAAAMAAGTCVLEQGSTTVYPALVQAQTAIQSSIAAATWPNGQAIGCDVSLTANGSGAGKGKMMDYFNGVAGSSQIDLAASSSPLSGSATASAPGLGFIETGNLMAFQVGGDGMVIAVRDDNPVTQLNMGQVTAIYNGNITTWNQLGANANGATGTIVPRSRILGSGSRDDMNRLFKVDRGASNTGPACSSGFATCEPTVVAATGLARLTTSQEEGDAVCGSASQIAYTSLANLAIYGPGTTACNAVIGGTGHTIKAISLQSCSYTGFSSATDPLTLTCTGAFVAPSAATAAVGGAYPAKRQLLLVLPTVAKMVAKYGTGNGTGWTDNLGLTKAMDVINYMTSNQGQSAVSAVNFISLTVGAKQAIPDADIDLNGGIGLTDIGQITGRWNQAAATGGNPAGWIRADVDNSGTVGLTDIGKITGQWGAAGFTYVAP
jgi:ABC-type phosphate transport system substrate-binding protein